MYPVGRRTRQRLKPLAMCPLPFQFISEYALFITRHDYIGN